MPYILWKGESSPMGAINLDGLQLIWVVEESDVDLDGQTCLGWKLVLAVGPEDRLASDHDDVVVLSSVGRGAQHVGEVLLLHVRDEPRWASSAA